MLRRYRDTFLAFLVQCLIALVLFAVFRSPVIVVAAGLVTALIVLQFFWDATWPGAAGAAGAASAAGKAKNFLFPAFLFEHLVPTTLVLAAIAIAPFLISLLSSEPLNQHYPGSDHSSLVNLIANLASALTVITLLVLIAKPKELRRFIRAGYPRQSITNAAFLDISLISVTTYTFIAALPQIQLPAEYYPLFSLHPLVNGIWLMLLLYLAPVAISYLVMFVRFRRDQASWKIFKTQDFILLEPFLIYTFLLGIFSQPPDSLFGLCVILCPLSVFVFMEIAELMGTDASEGRRDKFMPFSFKDRFIVANLIVYSIIISTKLEIFYLSIPLYAVAAWFAVFYFIGWYQERRRRRRFIKKIRTLSAEAPTDEWFDQKARAYHELRENG
ncbi:MAG: hypothetical protein LBK67_03085 [Coriobacteriales bacterium]|jgi:hypothetical protein|nr:hypothetical protein [Coriobacteriales bacterium]